MVLPVMLVRRSVVLCHTRGFGVRSGSTSGGRNLVAILGRARMGVGVARVGSVEVEADGER